MFTERTNLQLMQNYRQWLRRRALRRAAMTDAALMVGADCFPVNLTLDRTNDAIDARRDEEDRAMDEICTTCVES